MNFFAIFLILLAVSTVNISAQEINGNVTDCHIINPSCDGKGICSDNGQCRCFTTYFGFKINGTDDRATYSCSQNVYRNVEGYKTAVVVLLFGAGSFFAIAVLLSLYRLILEFVLSNGEVSRTITKYVLSITLFNALHLLIQCLDFYGNLDILGPRFYNVLFTSTHPLFVLTFCALFFHWVELYQKSIKHLKREEMLKKIRQDYEGKVTMEDILVKLSFLQKFKYVYLLFGVSTIAVFVSEVVIFNVSTSFISYKVMDTFFNAFFAVLWIGFSIAFVNYGVRLVKIMPPTVATKIKETTILVGVFSFSSLLRNLIDIATGGGQINILPRHLWIHWVTTICDVIGIYSAVFMYIPIWQWNLWFNPSMMKTMFTGSRTSNKSSKSEDSVAIPMGVMADNVV